MQVSYYNSYKAGQPLDYNPRQSTSLQIHIDYNPRRSTSLQTHVSLHHYKK